MKEIKEADRLVELYDETLTYLESKSKAIQCAIIDVSNTIEVLKDFLILDRCIKKYAFLCKVKQELESRLNK